MDTPKDVTAQGETEAKAKAALLEKITALTTAATTATKPVTVGELLADFLADMPASDLSVSTQQNYEGNARRSIKGHEIATRTIQSLTTGAVQKHLQGIADDRGWREAKMCKSVLSNVFKLAIEREIINKNVTLYCSPLKRHPKPVEDDTADNQGNAEGKPKKRRKTKLIHDVKRALTDAELKALLAKVKTDPRALELNVVPLVYVMAGTGCRIGEACALYWDEVDLEAGTAHIRATAIYIKGVGVVRQEHTKTDAGMRDVKLPSWLVDYLTEHKTTLVPGTIGPGSAPNTPRQLGTWGEFSEYVCCSTEGTLRDPSTGGKRLRDVLVPLGYDWMTGHNFRKTMATLLDESGATPREVSAQLGHSKTSMTQDVYMDKRRDAVTVGSLLDGVVSPSTSSPIILSAVVKQPA